MLKPELGFSRELDVEEVVVVSLFEESAVPFLAVPFTTLVIKGPPTLEEFELVVLLLLVGVVASVPPPGSVGRTLSFSVLKKNYLLFKDDQNETKRFSDRKTLFKKTEA